MSSHIPPDGFDYYLRLGSDRSYQAVADHYDVSKQAVVKCAKREKWQQRLDEIESKARAANDQRAVETLEELNEQHMKIWKAVEKRALEGLRNHQMETAMDSVRALDLATKNLRLISGEPTERTENVASILRRVTDRLLTNEDEDDWPEENRNESAPASEPKSEPDDDQGAASAAAG